MGNSDVVADRFQHRLQELVQIITLTGDYATAESARVEFAAILSDRLYQARAILAEQFLFLQELDSERPVSMDGSR